MISGDAGLVARVVNPKEFLSYATVAHARSLLGCILVRTSAGGGRRLLITEVEAYDGEKDLACHASKGRTARTEIMYRAGGIWYVYLCYGIHEMLNLVTGPAEYPAAVLIRGVSGIDGPGRLTRQLAIDRQLNGQPAHPSSGLHLEAPPGKVPAAQIRAGPRIGVGYAGPHWASQRWRFWLAPAFARSLAGLISQPRPPAPDSR